MLKVQALGSAHEPSNMCWCQVFPAFPDHASHTRQLFPWHCLHAEITEGEFLEVVTKTENVVCHFYHKDFERCKIVDKHLAALAKKYLEARFVKISAPVSWMMHICSAAAEHCASCPTLS